MDIPPLYSPLIPLHPNIALRRTEVFEPKQTFSLAKQLIVYIIQSFLSLSQQLH
jgi:hypothetical protein